MPNTFQQRCQLALTHPVTLGAVALLLVNDWLLKPLWHSDWTTGKLSDLAWMVFFPPLLAVCAVAGGSGQLEGAAGGLHSLPTSACRVLYAAYNTFAPLHDWINGRLHGAERRERRARRWTRSTRWSFLPAMAAALWVWHGTVRTREQAIRTRLHLYAVVIAALATVATSN